MKCNSKFEPVSNLRSKRGGMLATLVSSYIYQLLRDRRGGNETDANQRNAGYPWDGPAGGPVSPYLDSTIRGALGAGRPLDHSMCERLGIGGQHNLDRVRVHTDSRADYLSCALGARAFTVGRDIFFSKGSWDPDSFAGRRLIAHELTHVAQQEAGRVPADRGCLVVRPANDAFEQDADQTACDVTSSGRIDISKTMALRQYHYRPSLTIQRTAAMFAGLAATAPVRVHGGEHPYNCHMSALYWAFRALGDNQNQAGARIEAIATEKGGRRATIHNDWYGRNLCNKFDQIVPNQAALGDVQRVDVRLRVGDVLWVGDARSPAHSMVLVRRDYTGHFAGTFIRGFNNIGTLGAGPHNQYDNADRNIDVDRYWHTRGTITRFGMQWLQDRVLHRIPYQEYVTRAGVVRHNCVGAGRGTFRYIGP